MAFQSRPKSAQSAPATARPRRESAATGTDAGKGAPDLVSVVIINFNAGEHLSAAVESARAQEGVKTEILVIDNHSWDDSLAGLRRRADSNARLRVVELDENLGFARACNMGIQMARGADILLLNPDCRLLPGALADLRRALHRRKKIGMAGCRLINPDGSDQRGARRDIPNPWQIFCVAIQLHRLMPNHPRFRSFDRHDEPLPKRPIVVPAVSGACMLVKRAAISAVGKLDDDYFLHFEDLDWCLRFNAAGWQILFVPSATAVHNQGVCSAHRPIAVEYHKHRSLIRFLRKHFTAYYPTSFMALVAGIVTLRFVLLAPRLIWRRLCAPRRPAVGARAETARQR